MSYFRALLVSCIALGLQLCAADGAHRLLLADSESGSIRVLNLEDGDEVETLELSGPARLYTVGDGRYAFAVQREQNVTNAIDGGLWIDDHGDHFHAYMRDPVVFDFDIEGGVPTHFVENDGVIAVYNDGAGDASLMRLSEIRQDSPAVDVVANGPAHHGVAVPLDDQVLISIADDGESLPKGVDLVDMDSTILQEVHDCPLLHGSASDGDLVVLGCGDGVLVVDNSDSPMETFNIPSPDGEEGRVGTVIKHPRWDFFIGNHGPLALSKIDVAERSMELFPVPIDVSAFGFTKDGRSIVAITMDGQVHTISPSDGNITNSVELIAPYESGVRPVLAFAPGRVVVSDHSSGEIYVLDDETLDTKMTFDADGIPQSMTVVGWEFDDDDEHDHDHDHDDDDHDHDHDDDDHDHDHDHDHDDDDDDHDHDHDHEHGDDDHDHDHDHDDDDHEHDHDHDHGNGDDE
eukprot:scaffold633_cov321-Pavlova_lutheri.AAC.26